MPFIKFLAKFLRTLELARGELLGMGFFFVAILLYYGQLGYLVSRPDAVQRHAVLRAVYTRFYGRTMLLTIRTHLFLLALCCSTDH